MRPRLRLTIHAYPCKMSMCTIWTIVVAFLQFISSVHAQTCPPGVSGLAGKGCTVCPVGKYKCCTTTGTAPCSNCLAGTYNSITGRSSCYSCPPNSGSTCSASSSISCCTCNSGFTGPIAGPCSICAAGTYKATTGSAACTNCASGKYSGTSGATTSTTCVSCPTNSGGSCFGCSSLTSCKCYPGFYGPDGGVCTSCPSNSGASCIGCPQLAGCMCDIGFTGPNGGTCTVCAAGTYKTISDVTCSACPANSGSSCSGCYTSACPCNAGYTGGNFIAPYSTTACARFVALITWKPSLASVVTRNDASLGSSSLPTYNALGGPNGNGHVSFNRAQLQYLSVGPQSFNLKTNGGFTIVVIMCFTGTTLGSERIISMWSGIAVEMVVNRFTTAGGIGFTICNAGIGCFTQTTDNSIAQNMWGTLTITYSSTTFLLDMKLNGVGVLLNIGSGWNDKTLGGTEIGRSSTSSSFNMNADVAGVFMVDEWLSTAATTEITNAIMQGQDLTDTTCPSGNACTACAAGTYKTSSGSASCTTCPAGTTSPVGSTSSAACIVADCNAGYTGPSGGPCIACAAGTYKASTGSAACTDCGSGSYSATEAATSAAACVACPANSGSTCTVCSSSTGCTCNIGYTGPDGGVCSACVTGTYKDTTGTATCTGCPANSGSSCSGCYTSACSCDPGYTGGNFIGPYSTTACARFIALTPKPSFASVSTRSNAAVGTLPTYNALGGPNGKGHFSFDRAQSQYLDAGSRTFNIATNGGLTVVAVVRFTGTAGTFERILDMGSGAPNNNIDIARRISSDELQFGLRNGVTVLMSVITTGGLLVQNSWLTITSTYRASTMEYKITINDISFFGTTSTALTDRTVSATYIGRSPYSNDPYLNADIAGVFVVDEYLNPEATTAIATAMLNGVDLTDTTCPSGTACTQCPSGTYKDTSGSSTCLTCPAGTTSPVASTSSAACICNAGTTGNVESCITNSSTIEKSCGTFGTDACSASQSSDYQPPSYYASKALDDDFNSFSHTLSGNTDPTWWRLDFGRSMTVTKVKVYNRIHGTMSTVQRLDGFTIAVGDSPSVDVNAVCASNQPAPTVSPYMTEVTCPTPLTGRYLHISIYGPSRILSLAEVQVTGFCPVCLVCVAGKYKSVTGSAACIDCGPGTYSSTLASTACVDCPVGANSPPASTSSDACIAPDCPAGFTGPSGGPCVACAAGTYKAGAGSAACIDCTGATYAAAAAASCLTCPPNSGASCDTCSASDPSATCALKCGAQTDCTCNMGYFGPPGGVCEPCAAGTYKNNTVSATCTSCPAFSGAVCVSCVATLTCVCTEYTDGTCSACVTSSAPASKSIDFCVCGPGQFDSQI